MHEQGGDDRFGVDFGLVVQLPEEHVAGNQAALDTLSQPGLVEQIAHLHAHLHVLVGVEGGDAGARGTEGALGAQPLLLVAVVQHVDRQHELCPVGDAQIGERHTGGEQAVEFGEQRLDVDGDTRSEEVDRSGGEDP